jgi:hypothetical protein
MAIHPKQKSKGDRTSRGQRATSNELERPALLPGGAERSQQFKPEELGAAGSALTTDPDYPMKSTTVCKFANETHVTLFGDAKSVMRDFGTKDPDFLKGLIDQVGNASPKSNRCHEERLESWGVKQFVDEVGVKSMLAFIKEGKPTDAIEATLLAQMAATHAHVMRFATLLANANSLAERDSAERTFNKLMRTYAGHVEALQRYRSRNEKNKVVFQHVSVSEGGQAIVGNVTRPARERASRKRTRPIPLIPDARQAPMDIIGEQRSARVPLRRK